MYKKEIIEFENVLNMLKIEHFCSMNVAGTDNGKLMLNNLSHNSQNYMKCRRRRYEKKNSRFLQF